MHLAAPIIVYFIFSLRKCDCLGGKKEEEKRVMEWVKMKGYAREFMVGVAEMTVEFGKGCRDIVKQSLVNDDSYIVKNFGRDSYIGKTVTEPFANLFQKLSFFNEYLPEDKDPLHAWSVIFFVSILAFLGNNNNKLRILGNKFNI